MKCNLKQLLALAMTSLAMYTSAIYADGDTAQVRNLENRVTALEQRKGASGMINPQGRPQIRDGADLFVFGDLIYWNAHENGLQVAVKNEGSTTNLSDSKVKTIHGKWNVGFRTGIGYNTMHDGWDLRLTWLRFTDNGHNNNHIHGRNAIYPTRVHPAELPFFSPGFTKLKSAWHLRLNQLDLDLGREFFVSKWLTLRPHFGLRTDWIRQTLEADYTGPSNRPFANRFETELKDHWWGLGLEGGFDTQWGLGNGWSIFGDLSAAIIYGFHHMKYETEAQPTNVDVDMADRYRVSHPILDLEMGLRWDNMFSNDRFHLGLQIGWEHHIYFSQNQFPLFVDNASLGSFVANQGDLTLQGWTFSARFDF
jgi:hypothetical protein